MLIGIKRLGLFLHFNIDRYYLLLEGAVLYSRQGSIIALQGELVLLLTGDAVLSGEGKKSRGFPAFSSVDSTGFSCVDCAGFSWVTESVSAEKPKLGNEKQVKTIK